MLFLSNNGELGISNNSMSNFISDAVNILRALISFMSGKLKDMITNSLVLHHAFH